MSAPTGAALTAAAVLLSACTSGGPAAESPGPTCLDESREVARGASLPELKESLLEVGTPRPESLRVRKDQITGDLRIDLLDRRGQRLDRLDAWELEDGDWVAMDYVRCPG
jgi:hypothetical protein